MNIFISTLGTGDYRITRYYLGNPQEPFSTKYIQCALIHLLATQGIHFHKVYILLTERAKAQNWDSNETEPKLQSELETLARQLYPFEIVPLLIPTALHEETELQELFQKVFQHIPERSKVYFDITHSYRHLPLLIGVFLHYARVLKHIEIGGIYYGAFDAPSEVKPIIDLKFFSELQEWTRAVARFYATGDASFIADLLRQWSRYVLRETQGKDDIGRLTCMLANQLELFTLQMQTCRGLEIVENKEGFYLYQNLIQLKEKVELNRIPAPIIPLIDLLIEVVEPFREKASTENLLHAVDFCIRHNLIQQGYTLLKEYLVTKLLQSYYDAKGQNGDLVDRTYRGIAEKALGIIIHKLTDNPGAWKVGDSEEELLPLSQNSFQQDSDEKEVKPGKSEEELKQEMAICLTTPTSIKLQEIHQFLSLLIERRNDINHAGFSQNATKANKLKNELEKIYNKIKETKI